MRLELALPVCSTRRGPYILDCQLGASMSAVGIGLLGSRLGLLQQGGCLVYLAA